MRVESLADQLFFVTCRIEAQGASKSWTGTGFVYVVDTNNGPAHFLVTNKHVLHDAVKLTVRFVRGTEQSGQAIRLGQATQIELLDFNGSVWRSHPDADVDIAVMPLATVLKDMAVRGAPAFLRAVSPTMALGVGANFDTDSVEDLMFVGYPNGLYDRSSFLPIMRRGTSATPLDVDYDGKPAFLMDASVFPGSSGSPVFIVNRGWYVSRAGTVVVQSRFALVGIVASVHTRIVNAEVTKVSTGLVAGFQDMIDLGIVFKATAIDHVIQAFIEAAGLVRIAGADVTAAVEPETAADRAVEETLPDQP